MSIAGVVLAAGSGSRFGPGPPKVLALLEGRPLLAHAIDAVTRAGLSPVVVVLGYAAEQVAKGVDLTGVTAVHNPDHGQGQASSVKAGLQALPFDVEAAVVALGDQPGVTPAVIAALCEAYHRDLKAITVPLYGGRRGNPVLIARAVFSSVMALDGDTGARAIMEARPRWVCEVPADGLADPRDVDTPDDLRAIQGGAR
jgi:molybdenum cofactor cytidylyltransferase